MTLILLLVRIADLITTHVCINKYGVSVEGNPVARGLMSNSYIAYMLYNIILSIVLVHLSTKKIRFLDTALKVFIPINIIAVFINLWCCFL